MDTRCREQAHDVRTEEHAAIDSVRIDCVARDSGGKSIEDPAGLRFPGAYESVRIPAALEMMPTARVRQSRGRLRVGGAGIGRASSIGGGGLAGVRVANGSAAVFVGGSMASTCQVP